MVYDLLQSMDILTKKKKNKTKHRFILYAVYGSLLTHGSATTRSLRLSKTKFIQVAQINGSFGPLCQGLTILEESF